MERDQTTEGLSTKPIPGADPTGREIMARQFAAASMDPTGREAMSRQCAAQKDASTTAQAE
jgi:hypothetical protein